MGGIWDLVLVCMRAWNFLIMLHQHSTGKSARLSNGTLLNSSVKVKGDYSTKKKEIGALTLFMSLIVMCLEIDDDASSCIPLESCVDYAFG